MTIVFDLLDLIKVFLQHFAGLLGAVPSGGLVDDCHDGLVADNSPDIDRVVHPAEDPTLVGVLHVNVIKQLQPEGF